MSDNNLLLREWLHATIHDNIEILNEVTEKGIDGKIKFWIAIHDIWLKEVKTLLGNETQPLKTQEIIDFFANDYPKKPEGISRDEATELILEAIKNQVVEVVESDITLDQNNIAKIEKLD